jgi:predicted DNA-binding ribbon-helix-helix protein
MKNFGGPVMKSPVIKRSVVIDGHKTSVSLEDPFWNDLKEIAYVQRMTLSEAVAEIDKARQHSNLSSAIRLFVLNQVRMHGDPWQYSRVRRSGQPSQVTEEVMSKDEDIPAVSTPATAS